jgi:hypothetical protein
MRQQTPNNERSSALEKAAALGKLLAEREKENAHFAKRVAALEDELSQERKATRQRTT